MEYIPRSYKKKLLPLQQTHLPMDWIHHFFTTLYTTHQKFVYPLPSTQELQDLYFTDVEFLLCISDILMDYLVDMDTHFIDKIDSFITEYRKVVSLMYYTSVLTMEQKERCVSILNLSV